jgi:hypothetical protein
MLEEFCQPLELKIVRTSSLGEAGSGRAKVSISLDRSYDASVDRRTLSIRKEVGLPWF